MAYFNPQDTMGVPQFMKVEAPKLLDNLEQFNKIMNSRAEEKRKEELHPLDVALKEALHRQSEFTLDKEKQLLPLELQQKELLNRHQLLMNDHNEKLDPLLIKEKELSNKKSQADLYSQSLDISNKKLNYENARIFDETMKKFLNGNPAELVNGIRGLAGGDVKLGQELYNRAGINMPYSLGFNTNSQGSSTTSNTEQQTKGVSNIVDETSTKLKSNSDKSKELDNIVQNLTDGWSDLYLDGNPIDINDVNSNKTALLYAQHAKKVLDTAVEFESEKRGSNLSKEAVEMLARDRIPNYEKLKSVGIDILNDDTMKAIENSIRVYSNKDPYMKAKDELDQELINRIYNTPEKANAYNNEKIKDIDEKLKSYKVDTDALDSTDSKLSLTLMPDGDKFKILKDLDNLTLSQNDEHIPKYVRDLKIAIRNSLNTKPSENIQGSIVYDGNIAKFVPKNTRNQYDEQLLQEAYKKGFKIFDTSTYDLANGLSKNANDLGLNFYTRTNQLGFVTEHPVAGRGNGYNPTTEALDKVISLVNKSSNEQLSKDQINRNNSIFQAMTSKNTGAGDMPEKFVEVLNDKKGGEAKLALMIASQMFQQTELDTNTPAKKLIFEFMKDPEADVESFLKSGYGESLGDKDKNTVIKLFTMYKDVKDMLKAKYGYESLNTLWSKQGGIKVSEGQKAKDTKEEQRPEIGKVPYFENQKMYKDFLNTIRKSSIDAEKEYEKILYMENNKNPYELLWEI